MLKRYRVALLAILVTLALPSCGFLSSLWGYLNPPPPKQFGGAFETLAVDTYLNPAWGSLGATDGTDPIGDADAFAVLMKGSAYTPWSQITRLTAAQVLATSFQKYQASLDAVMFEGHGAPGINALQDIDTPGYTADQQYWGVGDDYANSAGKNSINNYQQNFGTGYSAITGRLKWLFNLSSDTVAAPAYVDPNDPQWTAVWSKAFGGSLHGIYGSWQQPGTCSDPNQPPIGRTCDITNGHTGQYFAQNILPTSSSTEGNDIHDAWIEAFMEAGQDARWTMYEDENARDDQISGPGDGTAPPSYASTLSGSIDFFFSQPPSVTGVNSVSVAAVTFALNPQSLTNEAINASSAAAQYEPQAVATPISNSDNGSVYKASTNYGGTQQQYATSGAVVYTGPKPANPIAFSQSTALSAAENFISTTYTMPSDAVLYSTLNFWDYSLGAGTVVNDATEFIFHHANSAISGFDGIKVVVSDKETITRTCTTYTSIPPLNKPVCTAWNTATTNAPYISAAYRLWRSQAGANSSVQPAGATSIDAATAASALPSNFVITAYQQGWWYPDMVTPSSNGARAAWIFTIAGARRVGVDAYTGQILGSTMEI